MILTAGNKALSQNDTIASSSRSYHLTLYLNAGYSSDMDSVAKHMDRTGLALSARIMLSSKHPFSLGAEVDYLNISHYKAKKVNTEFGLIDIENKLNCLPILFIVNYKIFNFDVSGGYGPVNIKSQINAFGEISTSSEWDYALMFSTGYNYEIIDNLSLNVTFKYLNIPPLFKELLSLQAGIFLKLNEI
jgi:hypothetical protein